MRSVVHAAILLILAAPARGQDFNQGVLKGRVVAPIASCNPLVYTVLLDVKQPTAACNQNVPGAPCRHAVTCVGDLDPSFPARCFTTYGLEGACIEFDGYMYPRDYGGTYTDELHATSAFIFPYASCN